MVAIIISLCVYLVSLGLTRSRSRIRANHYYYYSFFSLFSLSFDCLALNTTECELYIYSHTSLYDNMIIIDADDCFAQLNKLRLKCCC